MKHLKRLFCLLLALVVALSLCACGADNRKDEEDDDEDDRKLADLFDGQDTAKKAETATATTTSRVPALKRGNEVGDVCYDAELQVITAEGIQEETVDPTAYGKVTVINFWYTACGSAVEDLPYFDAIAKKYGDQIAVVAVHGMIPETAPAYIKALYPDSPIVFLSDYIPEGENTTEMDRTGYYTMLGGVNNAYPRTVVLNEKGIITHIFNQSVTESQLETAVLEAMGRM